MHVFALAPCRFLLRFSPPGPSAVSRIPAKECILFPQMPELLNECALCASDSSRRRSVPTSPPGADQVGGSGIYSAPSWHGQR